MVHRVEVVLFLVLILLLIVGVSIQNRMDEVKKQMKVNQNRRVQINNGRLREVNQTGVEDEYWSDLATLIGTTWHYNKFRMRNHEIRSLSSDQASRSKNRVTLSGHVILRKVDGTVIHSERVNYTVNSRILRTDGPFYGEKNGSYVRGINLYYDMGKKVTHANKAFGHYKLNEGNNE